MVKLDERRWDCDVPAATLSGIQHGVFRTRYRDKLFLKSPFDVVLYMQLIGRLKPRSIIEIGSREGGSALWFHDTAAAWGPGAQVVSVDLSPPQPAENTHIAFLKGDAQKLEECLTDELLASLPHPWLVTEDSRHDFDTCSAVLEFFDTRLLSDDYIVIEDGVVQFLAEEQYRSFDNGPNRAVAAFLMERGIDFEIDTSLCDHFGYNVTYNPNGWLRRL